MNDDLSKHLLEKLKSLPKKPGVYLFRTASEKIIYIGKAKILRNRVRSYFQKLSPDIANSKTGIMVKKIVDLDFIVTDTEKEALILEANLVKTYRPKYNINLKDDKSFPYIRITNEPFPQIFATRQKINDGSEYFGPYTEVKIIRSLLLTLRKIFPVRSCRYKLNDSTIAGKKYKLCLDYHIKRCGGPCEALVSQQEYGEMVRQVKSFLMGHTEKIGAMLKERMLQSAEKQQFEHAADFRDRLREIETFRAKQKVVDVKPVDRDILALAVRDDLASGVLFKEREGKIIGRRTHMLEGVGGFLPEKVMENFVMQIYINETYIPPEMFLSNDLSNKQNVREWLAEKRNGAVRIVIPQKGDKAKLTEMCRKNAQLLLGEMIIQQSQQKDYIAHSVESLQKDLSLPELPMRIEGFDISNIQGKDAVASLISFYNGVADRKSYRIFKMKCKDEPDDFAMIAEAVQRRYSRLQKEEKDMPDLIVIDGGKGQLSAACNELRELGLSDISIVGLAKRLDEVFIPEVSEPQNIPKISSGLKLLQRVRDETHRFALMHHRKQRKKRTLTSELDTIPGIGPERRTMLLKYFGSLTALKDASPESIAQVQSIGKKQAEDIYNHFHNKK